MMLLSAACFFHRACSIGIIELKKTYFGFGCTQLSGIPKVRLPASLVVMHEWYGGRCLSYFPDIRVFFNCFLLFLYLTLGLFENLDTGRACSVLFAPLCLASISMPWYDQTEAGFIYTLVFLALYVSSLFIFRSSVGRRWFMPLAWCVVAKQSER